MINRMSKIFNKQHSIISALIILIIIYAGLYVSSDYLKNKTDFANYYTASSMFVDGKNLSIIYDNRHFKRQSNAYGIDDTIVSYVPHTPPTLLLYTPLAFLNPDSAKFIWSILNLLFLAGSMYLLHRIYKIQLNLILLTGLSLVIPVFNNFLLGQAYLFILFMVSLGLFLWHNNKHLFAGIIIGLASSIKPFPMFFIIPAIINKRWNILYGIIIGFTIPHLIVYSISPEIYEPYIRFVLPATLSGHIQNPFHHGFRSYTVLLRNIFIYDPFRNPGPVFNSPCIFDFLRMFISLMIIGFFSLLTYSMKKSKQIRDIDCASLFLIASLLIAPVTSSYQYVLLIPPVLVVSKLFNSHWNSIITCFITFFICGYFYQIPYIELIFMICMFIFILLFLKNSISRKYTGFAIISILLFSLIIPYSLSCGYQVNEIVEPDTKIKTTGFPDELRVSKDIIYFSQIANGIYDINYYKYSRQFQNDKFMPCYLHHEWDTRFLSLHSNKYSESINMMHSTHIVMDNEFDLEYFQNIGYIVNLDYLHQDTFSIIAVSALSDNEYKTHIQIISSGILDKKVLNGAYATRLKDSGNTYFLEKGLEYFCIKRFNISNCDASVETLYQNKNHIRDFDVSIDEKLISFAVEKDSGNMDMFVLNIDTKALSRIIYHSARDYSPAFFKKFYFISSAPEYLYFISERGGGLNDGRFYRVNLSDLDEGVRFYSYCEQ